MTEAPFRTAFRGYEPTDVDQAIAQLKRAVENANAELGRVTVDLQHARAQLTELGDQRQRAEVRVDELERQLSTVGRPSYAEFGETIGRILALAEQEAEELRSSARAEADRVRADAESASQGLRDKAERESAELLSATQLEATRTLETAKRKADEIIDHADRESTARQEEAEALYEHQRQRATAAAADFEKTLAGRRDEAAREFEVQLAAHTDRLNETIARRDAAEAEASRLLEQANQQARVHVEAAQQEADQLVGSARAQADRIRNDSTRELAAATQRRDAITAQLTNVRQMLATLGQGAAMPQLDIEEVVAAPAAPTTDVEVVGLDGGAEAEESIEPETVVQKPARRR